jgi:hypothetical protein
MKNAISSKILPFLLLGRQIKLKFADGLKKKTF